MKCRASNGGWARKARTLTAAARDAGESGLAGPASGTKVRFCVSASRCAWRLPLRHPASSRLDASNTKETRNRLVTRVMRVGRVFCVCAVGSAGVPARRTLSVERFFNTETRRRRDFWCGGVTAAGQADACPSRRSAMEPETILPHGGRRLVRTLALHCSFRRLVGTLALQIMLIMSKLLLVTLNFQLSLASVARASCPCVSWAGRPCHFQRSTFTHLAVSPAMAVAAGRIAGRKGSRSFRLPDALGLRRPCAGSESVRPTRPVARAWCGSVSGRSG